MKSYYPETLLESIEQLNFKLYYSKPFGNCFFNSIAKYFRLKYKTNINGMQIRKNIVEYILDNNKIFNFIISMLGIKKKELNIQLNELKKNGVYELEVFDILPVIMATKYNVKISIYTFMESNDDIISKNDCETYYPIENRNENLEEISLLYANVEHYDLLYYIK